ncbi:DHA2 family efflux MFS transporter permease subunit [Phenylobacterium sp. LjRoot225]|uniref:DHA2 family efflux MFS transporter permease subunit n=1 Tax=Phenylobacterium sp. LjRoot225 TaxID=3342285 RepID=UPI003ED171AD
MISDEKSGKGARVIATGGLMLATLMVALDSTIANVALPHVQGSLSAAQDQITWVLTSYIVGTALMTPLSGWLALKLGRKPLFLISIVGFVAISMLCGMATSLPEMVFFRFLQGVAGAAMMPLSQAAILDMWPQPAIPQVMAIWSAVTMVAPIMGPTLGGFLTEHLSWRWVFYINLPVGALAFGMTYLALERDRGGRERPFDWVGFLALVFFTGGVQLLADRGMALDWFDSREIWLYSVLAACGAYVFVVQTITAKHPFFHLALFRDRNFMSSVGFAVFLSALLLSTTALLPSFMQNLMGYSAMQSGMAMMPRGIGSLISFTLAPFIAARFGPRRTIMLGLVVTAVALWRMSQFDLSMDVRPIETAGMLLGLGQGLAFNPLTVLAFATLETEHRTEAAVFSNMFRTLGGSLGIAALQGAYIQQSATAHERLAGGVIASDPVIRWTMPQILDGALSGLEAINGEVSRQASMMAYDTVFAWMGVGTVLIVPLVLMMRPARTRGEKLQEIHVE